MFKYFLSTLFLIHTIHSYPAIVISPKEPAKHVILGWEQKDLNTDLSNYKRIKPSDFEKLTGHKLTLKEKIVFKISQWQLKKSRRRDGANDIFRKNPKEPFKWHWGGFFLGLLLPIVGLIITAFFKDDQRKNRITSAAIGTLVFCLGFLLIAAASF